VEEMNQFANQIKYDLSVGFLKRMLRQERLTLEQAQIAERHLREVYGAVSV
jgi:hypothetical protein